MTRDLTLLQEVGEALYGPLWQSPLARDLEIADRSVRRWVAGQYPVPDWLWPKLAAICAKRGAALQAWAKRLG